MSVTLYSYGGCSTCKKALAWLKNEGVEPKVVPIVEQPPTARELKRLMKLSGLPLTKWFNTSGQSYRALIAKRGKESVAALSEAEAVELLAADGKLIKRPVLVHGERVLVGFRPEAYAAAGVSA